MELTYMGVLVKVFGHRSSYNAAQCYTLMEWSTEEAQSKDSTLPSQYPPALSRTLLQSSYDVWLLW